MQTADDKCMNCGATFRRNFVTQVFCRAACASAYVATVRYTKEELTALVEAKPISEIAKETGVSDHAVRKRCKRLGIAMKPRGFWQKRKAGK